MVAGRFRWITVRLEILYKVAKLHKFLQETNNKATDAESRRKHRISTGSAVDAFSVAAALVAELRSML